MIRNKIHKGMKENEGFGVPLEPGPAPLALRPTSRARVCSSLTASRRVSGTRKYFICFTDMRYNTRVAVYPTPTTRRTVESDEGDNHEEKKKKRDRMVFDL